MDRMRRRREMPWSTLTFVALLCGACPFEARAAAGAGSTSTSATTIVVSFKLDPRVSGPTYGGERWVSPATFDGAAGQDVVEARAEVVDAIGRSLDEAVQWIAADPGMVRVSPGSGKRVRIEVKRPGESKLAVVSRGASRELLVRARTADGATQIGIVRLGPGRPVRVPAAPRAATPTTPAMREE